MQLVLKPSGPDTIVVQPGSILTIPVSLARGSGAPIDSVDLYFTDPIQNAGVDTLISRIPAMIDIIVPIPANLEDDIYPYSFSASKAGYLRGDLNVYVRVAGRWYAQMNLSAHAANETAIALSWERPLRDNGTDTLVVMHNGSLFNRYPINAPDTTATVTGLQSGTVYTFFILSTVAYSDTIRWATAKRMGPVRLYETADNMTQNHQDHNAGLVVSTGTSESVLSQNPDAELSDVVLASDPTSLSGLAIVSPDVTSLSQLENGKNT